LVPFSKTAEPPDDVEFVFLAGIRLSFEMPVIADKGEKVISEAFGGPASKPTKPSGGS